MPVLPDKFHQLCSHSTLYNRIKSILDTRFRDVNVFYCNNAPVFLMSGTMYTTETAFSKFFKNLILFQECVVIEATISVVLDVNCFPIFYQDQGVPRNFCSFLVKKVAVGVAFYGVIFQQNFS